LERPLEVLGNDECMDVKVVRTPGDGNGYYAVSNSDDWLAIFDYYGNYIVEVNDENVFNSKDVGYIIRNKGEYDVKVNIKVDEGYKNALSKTTNELERQKKLLEDIRDLQQQINELKEKELTLPYIPYRYPTYPNFIYPTYPLEPTYFQYTTCGTTSDGTVKK
jgi:hypothetical protein